MQHTAQDGRRVLCMLCRDDARCTPGHAVRTAPCWALGLAWPPPPQEVLAQKHALQADNKELQDKYNQKAMWVLGRQW